MLWQDSHRNITGNALERQSEKLGFSAVVHKMHSTNKYSETICTEISLDNKPQTCMILKSKCHNTYKEIGSIIKIEHYIDGQSWHLLSGFNFLSSSRSSQVPYPLEFNPVCGSQEIKYKEQNQYHKINNGTSRASQEIGLLFQSQNH